MLLEKVEALRAESAIRTEARRAEAEKRKAELRARYPETAEALKVVKEQFQNSTVLKITDKANGTIVWEKNRGRTQGQ